MLVLFQNPVQSDTSCLVILSQDSTMQDISRRSKDRYLPHFYAKFLTSKSYFKDIRDTRKLAVRLS